MAAGQWAQPLRPPLLASDWGMEQVGMPLGKHGPNMLLCLHRGSRAKPSQCNLPALQARRAGRKRRQCRSEITT